MIIVIGIIGSYRLLRSTIAAVVKSSTPFAASVRVVETPINCANNVHFLETVCRSDKKMDDIILIFPQVITLSEADYIRKMGGYIWVADGRVSLEVPIQNNDIMVTNTAGGRLHYLDPLEAISEQIIQHYKKTDIANNRAVNHD